ncbi:MAG: dockerin type I repeat-containing protein [Oscillospiraceae bacterium]|nr:dockerin type I repeat-containing protein [Oscillospiraceae bacterium]
MCKFKFIAALCAAVLSINMYAAVAVNAEETVVEDAVVSDTKETLYSIEYDANGGVGTITNALPAKAGSEVKLSIWALRIEGYSHIGWTDGEKTYERGETIIMPDHDLKLTAVYKKLYTLTYEDFSEIGYDVPLSDGTVVPGTEVYLPNLAMFNGEAMFNGWRVNGEYYAPQTSFVMPEEDVHVAADWLSPISFAYSAGDVDGVVGESIIYTTKYPGAQFNTADTPVIARLGYKVTGWHMSGTEDYYGVNESYIIPDKDTIFEIIWSPIIIGMSFDANGGTGTMEREKYEHDTVINISKCLFEKEGQKLLGWQLRDEYYGPEAEYQVKIKKAGESLKFKAIWIDENENPGDINGDGVADLTDMTLLSLDIIGDYDITDEKAKTNADVLKDGEVNLADLAYYKQFISQDKILLGLPSEGE